MKGTSHGLEKAGDSSGATPLQKAQVSTKAPVGGCGSVPGLVGKVRRVAGLKQKVVSQLPRLEVRNGRVAGL